MKLVYNIEWKQIFKEYGWLGESVRIYIIDSERNLCDKKCWVKKPWKYLGGDEIENCRDILRGTLYVGLTNKLLKEKYK